MMTTKNTPLVEGEKKGAKADAATGALYAQRDILIDGVAFAAGEEIPGTVDEEQVKICVRLGSVGGPPVPAQPAAE